MILPSSLSTGKMKMLDFSPHGPPSRLRTGSQAIGGLAMLHGAAESKVILPIAFPTSSKETVTVNRSSIET